MFNKYGEPQLSRHSTSDWRKIEESESGLYCPCCGKPVSNYNGILTCVDYIKEIKGDIFRSLCSFQENENLISINKTELINRKINGLKPDLEYMQETMDILKKLLKETN